MWPSTDGLWAFYCSVFISFTFLLPVTLEQMDYHIVHYWMRILQKRMTLKTGWIILIPSWLPCWTIVLLPMQDLLTFLDTHLVCWWTTSLHNLHYMMLPHLPTCPFQVLSLSLSLQTQIHTTITWISHTLWKLVLRMIGLTRFTNSFEIASVHLVSQTWTVPLSSMWLLGFFFSTGLCTIERSMVNISWWCQSSVVMDSFRRHTMALGTKVFFQSGCACCGTSGGPCWLMTSNGTSKLATSAKFTKLPSCTSPWLFLSWADCFPKFILISWLCLTLVATASVHCPGPVHSDSISGIVNAVIWECFCYCIFYFQEYTLSLGSYFWAHYWQCTCIHLSFKCAHKLVWHLPYPDLSI